MDIKFPINESIDSLLRYGVSGGVLLSYLILSFPEKFNSDCFEWHYFVIFSFIFGFLIFAFIRIRVDRKEDKDYYGGVVGKIIESKFGKRELSVHLGRALENYYFWRKNKRADMSKIQRRASYIYFYLSIVIVFVLGITFLLISLLLRKFTSKLSFESLSLKLFNFELSSWTLSVIISLFIVFSIILCFISYKKYEKTYKEQKYILRITFLNELDEFIQFVERIRRINSSNPINHGTEKIISELDDP